MADHAAMGAGARAVVVMGVTGAGKTTVGALLAAALGVPFVDGDALHSAASVAKMSSGVPLTDLDRWAWLDAVGRRLAAAPEGIVVACSALKRSYRQRLLSAAPGTVFVHLDGSREMLQARLSARQGHFMDRALLDSQLTDLESLQPDEPGFRLRIDRDPSELAAEIRRTLLSPSG